ncbi:MAG: type II toxin-antitoxin system HicA family toxin [Bacteroidales bacterium]|nr:type II toxin-antitoxin system HicA family toxin [Bacteroidales bacterium]MBQ7457743.1 type II toxin-antitoxin system HicA family toxin [Bacteroidales bacterium]MBQ9530030.1 type II toxin-antitoxin system HicA family toxin [Bacteroidales bacterium]
MKYSELERKLRRNGCYNTGKQCGGHPLWYSPITGKTFRMSNHASFEVNPTTLHSILKDAGVR